MMVLPGLGGQWLDKRWGTSFLALLGFAIGLASGIWYLLAITREPPRRQDEATDGNEANHSDSH